MDFYVDGFINKHATAGKKVTTFLKERHGDEVASGYMDAAPMMNVKRRGAPRIEAERLHGITATDKDQARTG